MGSANTFPVSISKILMQFSVVTVATDFSSGLKAYFHTSLIIVVRASFLSLLRVKRISSPSPLDDDSPAIREPKLIVCFRYKSVRRTEIAQFGISPIKEAITG